MQQIWFLCLFLFIIAEICCYIFNFRQMLRIVLKAKGSSKPFNINILNFSNTYYSSSIHIVEHPSGPLKICAPTY